MKANSHRTYCRKDCDRDAPKSEESARMLPESPFKRSLELKEGHVQKPQGLKEETSADWRNSMLLIACLVGKTVPQRRFLSHVQISPPCGSKSSKVGLIHSIYFRSQSRQCFACSEPRALELNQVGDWDSI